MPSLHTFMVIPKGDHVVTGGNTKNVPGTFSFLGVGAVKRGKALNRLQAVE